MDASPLTNVDRLEDQLSAPSEGVIEALGQLEGDIIVLGAGGKMGPTLARMARRASVAAGVARRVIAVSRFRSGDLPERMQNAGVETVSCDLLDEQAVAELPDAPNIIFMAGMKFGAVVNPALTWAMNCYLPALICRRYRTSRMAVFSSGNIYGMTPVATRGSLESDPLRPTGEYATTVLGRERMFEYFSREMKIPVILLRLNYATELRYGVLVDLAQQVAAGKPVDLTTGWVNVIWQSEANSLALESLPHATSPPRPLNLAGPEILRVRDVATRFGELLDKPVHFSGCEAEDALLSNASASYELFGTPQISAEQMIHWTADWILRGGELLGKPTHFESRDGRF